MLVILPKPSVAPRQQRCHPGGIDDPSGLNGPRVAVATDLYVLFSPGIQLDLRHLGRTPQNRAGRHSPVQNLLVQTGAIHLERNEP